MTLLGDSKSSNYTPPEVQLRQSTAAVPEGPPILGPLVTVLLLAISAALAMLVTLTGVTGVIATSVSQRIQEFGVRLALGARPPQVLLMVIAQWLTVVAAGLAIGAAASIALTRVFATFLFETTPTDPGTFGVVALVFLVAGTLACMGPALRATRADPMAALRSD
jgi:putative ABC transport system permease protein